MEAAMMPVLLLICGLVTLVSADVPVNCSYEEIRGIWNFNVGEENGDRTIDCSVMGDVSQVVTVELQYPNLAIDPFGNRGYWTMISNQGFEVVVHGRSYFAFSKYVGDWSNSTSYCDRTMPGWSHDVLGNNWACFVGEKVSPKMEPESNLDVTERSSLAMKYRRNPEFIAKINSVQSTWTAQHYSQWESMTLEQMMMHAGGHHSSLQQFPEIAPSTRDIRDQVDALPANFDWRDVDSINYVSPVRNQGRCGSCYAFAALAMNEARLRVHTNNTVQLVFAPQDVMDCSHYSQACDGGFGYQVGKYAQDFGLVEEKCNVYTGKGTGSCKTDATCDRHYNFKYGYIGGFYGGCNEDRMRLSLVHGGPIVVGYKIYPDFWQYSSGIYQHTGLTDDFNPYQSTSHAVAIVGYGIDAASGLKYWTVKNSWGDTWGEEGYFRIARGTNECAIESRGMESLPVF